MTALGGPAVALVGPTASGKSALAHAFALASEGRTEIVSVDAMGVYRGMDIATAKATALERSQVTYHLLDLVEPFDEFTVAQFQRAALQASEEIWSRGHTVLYVGGTGLYARAVVDNLEIPGRYPALRRRLEERVPNELAALYNELVARDPLAASRVEATNARRIVRALEVTLGSSRCFSSFGIGLASYGEVRIVQVGLDVAMDVLDERIAARFRRWMDEGLLEEVERLSARAGGVGPTARQAVGYRELLRHLEDGEPLERCVDEAIAKSRRLARRQRSWFRRDPRVEWFGDVDEAATRLGAVLSEFSDDVRD